jgi:hypothetical protein
MNYAAYIAWAMAGIFFADVVWEEIKGEAAAIKPGRGGGNIQAARATDKKGFDTIITYESIRFGLIFAMGTVFWMMHGWISRADLLDPANDEVDRVKDETWKT